MDFINGTTLLNKITMDTFQNNINNGILDRTLAVYGDGSIDPNETLEPIILTRHANAPSGAGTFYYISTYFFSARSASSSRTQIALGYTNNNVFKRYCYNGTWDDWEPMQNIVTTNANGTAVKFPDGTMICYGTLEAAANEEKCVQTLPATFLNNQGIVILTNRFANNKNIIWTGGFETNNSIAGWNISLTTGAPSARMERAGYIAIGRWK